MSTLNSFESAKQTTMYRIWFTVSTTVTWYKIIHEANQQYGQAWRCQGHVARKLKRNQLFPIDMLVWFEVPDANFASWIAVKHGVVAKLDSNK